MNKTLAKKYLSAINGIKRKYITVEDISETIGKFPEVIAQDLTTFSPMIMMDMELNLKDIVPEIEKYIEEENAKAEPKSKPTVRVTQKDMSAYDSICDFVYQKMTAMGTVDRYAVLTDKDLKTLKKLINEEQARRKGKK